MRKKITTRQSGFSLIELLVVVAVLMIVMGVVMKQVELVQKRYSAEEQRLDISQESREFFDQLIRDLHQAGYPNSKMFATGELMSPPQNDRRNAVGLVKFAYDEVWFEGDVDGDGQVDVIDYKLLADANGQCPCRISRSVVSPKADATAPMTQVNTNWSTELQQVVNSGGANGGASLAAAYTIYGTTYVGGSTQNNNTLYANYKTANVFTAYNNNGVEVTPTDYNTDPTKLKSIRTIRINVNLLTTQPDLQTKMRSAVTLAASVRLPTN